MYYIRLCICLVLVISLSSTANAANSNNKKKIVPTFKIEYGWLSEYDGGYLAHFKIPVHLEIPSWTMALLFPERVYNITLWQATFNKLTPDGRVVYAKQTQWNGRQWPGMVLDQRFLLRFNITPGIDYNGYSGPKPDILFLGKVFMPNRTIDYEHEMQVVNYTYYSKPRSVYFREFQLATIPASTTEATTSTASTTTTFNPFKNSGQEEEYGVDKWWFVDSAKTNFTTTTTTVASTTTQRPANWWQFAHEPTPPKPTPIAVNCEESAEARAKTCKRKRRRPKRCFLPTCEGNKFDALQCWKARGYCWCVNTISGAKFGKTMVKLKDVGKLDCFKGDQSRTEAPTLPPITTTTPSYVIHDYSETSDQPVFAPRNSYGYKQVIHNSLLFFEAQRSGILPANRRVSWRESAHTNDGMECGKDLSGGYYTSGGYIKFGFPTAFAMTQLAWSFLEAKDAYEEAWQTKFLKDTLKWATDYFIEAHTGQYEFYGQVGDPVYENEKWTRPENMKRVQRPCYKLTTRSPGTDLAAETAAALAATAAVWMETGSDKTDPYVQLLIKHAKELYKFADKYRGVYHMSIRAAANYFPSSGYEDELAWASMWLYIATKEKMYLSFTQANYFRFTLYSQETEFSWDRKSLGVQLLLSKYTKQKSYMKPLVEFCDSVLPGGTAEYTPHGLLFTSKWGPIRYACNAGFICMVASKLQKLSKEKKLKYRKFGEDQIDYILGKTGRSFVIGFGKNYPTQPHHRSSSCNRFGTCDEKDLNSLNENPQILTGAVVGGPDENDMWMNDRTNSMSNAVSLDFNSAFQSAVVVLRQFQLEYKAWYGSQWKRKPT